MQPREWSDRWWIALTVAAYPIAYDLGVGSYSLATGVIMLAGATLEARRALWIAAVSSPGVALMALTGTAGWDDAGYVVGRVFIAWGAARWAAAERPLQHPREVFGLAGVMLVVALATAVAFAEPTFGLQLKTYYAGVLILSLFIGIFYSLKLVRYPLRVLGMVAALTPYYALGLAVALALRALELAGTIPIASVAFHGFTAHLPADALTAVVVCFLTGPKSR